MKDEAIRNRGPKKRNPECFQLLHAITLPAGTILRHTHGEDDKVFGSVAFGKFVIETKDASEHPETFKRVISA